MQWCGLGWDLPCHVQHDLGRNKFGCLQCQLRGSQCKDLKLNECLSISMPLLMTLKIPSAQGTLHR